MTLKGYGISAITGCTIVSIVLAGTVDMTGYELGAFFNLFIPPVIGGIAIIIYLLVCWITKEKVIRLIIMILLCCYCIYVGLAFHWNSDYLNILPI
jgi:hypothetical protein